jgi:hypothetical protein
MEIWAISWKFIMSIHYVLVGNWKDVSVEIEAHKNEHWLFVNFKINCSHYRICSFPFFFVFLFSNLPSRRAYNS